MRVFPVGGEHALDVPVRRTSCGGPIFLVDTACHDLQRIVRQRSLTVTNAGIAGVEQFDLRMP
jgi:hypothetical protein